MNKYQQRSSFCVIKALVQNFNLIHWTVITYADQYIIREYMNKILVSQGIAWQEFRTYKPTISQIKKSLANLIRFTKQVVELPNLK